MTKTYSTLYARATTGKILEWFVEQEGGKYRVISGQQDGKKVVSEWSLASPKNVGKANETTDVEQATIEIEALYTKKKKQKYKDKVEDIDVQTYFKPMLAKKYVDYKDKINVFDGNWLAQLKFNGCVSGDTMIQLKGIKDPVSIKKVVDEHMEGKVLSFNFKKNRKEYKKILNRKSSLFPDGNWLEITLENGSTIQVTDNHPFFMPTLKCWRMAGELVIGDELYIH
jgi:intein/homing endonuclease